VIPPAIAEAIQHAIVFFSGTICAAAERSAPAIIETKENLACESSGMNEEGGAAIDAGAQHAQTFVGGVPGF